MQTWVEVVQEIRQRNGDNDAVRRESIRKVEEITGRPLIIYATDFMNVEKVQASGSEVSIDSRDKIAFNDVISAIEGDSLDVLIHSPGGSAEAAESIIDLLRSKFSSLRMIVPDLAKSAATMMCCAADQLLMDEKSELGPIDPQMMIVRGDKQVIRAPAQAIIDQFDLARKSISENPSNLPVWLPIIQTLSPALLMECQNADRLSRELVKSWLERYMFYNDENRVNKAIAASEYLAKSQEHLSHGRRIGIEQLQSLGFNILDTRTIPVLRDAIWNLYLSIMITFEHTSAFKITENGHGRALIRHLLIQQIELPGGQQPAPRPVSMPNQKKPRKRH
jgi:ATP-dependent protease ClpP protease subunit